MKKPEKKAADMTVKELASYIDYSVLKPEFTEEEIIDFDKRWRKTGMRNNLHQSRIYGTL